MAVACAGLLAVVASGCGGLAPPALRSPHRISGRTPVILVPGISGSQLRDADAGRLLWGKGTHLLGPWGRGGRIALPLDPEAAWGHRLEAPAVLEQIRLGFFRRPIYGPLIDRLVADGYRRGELRDPRPDDTLFPFPYDWRQENSRTAGALLEGLERLRRVRGEARLHVALICQSNGAHLCRYFAKYGGAALDEAEAGRRLPASLAIDKVILVGTSNGGSIRMLRELHRGRRYVPLVGRHWAPEVLFSFVSLYQDLPSYRDDPVLDEAGNPIDGDVFDAATWERYGWSAFAAGARRRILRRASGEPGRFEPRRHLQRRLDLARRFQELLRRDPVGLGSTRYYSIQNVFDPTPDRAVVLRRHSGHELLFTGDRELRRRPRLARLATANGDGHATRESQAWLSPWEAAALAPPVHLPGDHFGIILEEETQERILAFLAE